MEIPHLKLGAVYLGEFHPDPVRVIAFDKDVLMYDIWFPHKNAWAMAKLNRNLTYYRTSTDIFRKHFLYMRMDEYTETEFTIHRPDLPFSFAQFRDIEWHQDMPTSLAEIESILASTDAVKKNDSKSYLDVPKIYLSPFGPNGAWKPAMLISALNGQTFTKAELLWHAWQLQEPHLREKRLVRGVGLHRSGLHKRIPSYYIWGAGSRMDEPDLTMSLPNQLIS